MSTSLHCFKLLFVVIAVVPIEVLAALQADIPSVCQFVVQ